MDSSGPEIPHNLRLVKDEDTDVPPLVWLLEMQARFAAMGVPELSECCQEIYEAAFELAAAAREFTELRPEGNQGAVYEERFRRLDVAIGAIGYGAP